MLLGGVDSKTLLRTGRSISALRDDIHMNYTVWPKPQAQDLKVTRSAEHLFCLPVEQNTTLIEDRLTNRETHVFHTHKDTQPHRGFEHDPACEAQVSLLSQKKRRNPNSSTTPPKCFPTRLPKPQLRNGNTLIHFGRICVFLGESCTLGNCGAGWCVYFICSLVIAYQALK
jgi:hypothetical protein